MGLVTSEVSVVGLVTSEVSVVELVTNEVSVVGLVTNEEMCKVVWGIIIKNLMHKYSFIVSELLR